ncbi:MAG: hypothetical protein IT178_20250 [Acidobacteria bacterium]|nr:hypothetical protein [Acidobacteriota bacterium]
MIAAASALVFTVACGGSPAPAPAATPAPAAAPAATPAADAPSPAGFRPIEPAEGSSSGHIDLFSWSAADGADGYKVRVTAATDGRVIWDSPVITGTEARLPNTVALEPEAYFWQVTALKGGTELVASPTVRFLVTP